jgi:TetR/AcrR family transcriptional regulator, regulator of autoinduction and epiphytic fitness
MTRPVKRRSKPLTKRPYRSALRAEQAGLTRARILDAAEALFLAGGYGATTMAAIASEADVAVDTVYATFGSKRSVLQELMDVRVGGDDQPTALLERPEPRAVQSEPDQRRRVAMVAAGITSIHERARRVDDLMLSAAGSDPDIAALRADIQQRQRLRGMRAAVGIIKGEAGLRPGLDDERAVDILWAIAGPDLHRLLRDQRSWSVDEYRAWLADSIERLLLP